MKKLIKKILMAGIPVPGVMKPVICALYRFGVIICEGGTFVKKLLWIEPVLRSVCTSVGTGLRADRLPYMRGRGQIRLGDRVNLSGRSCFYFARVLGRPPGNVPEIVIGNRVFIGDGCTFSCARSIRVGDDVLIAGRVRIHDNDGHPLDHALRLANEPSRFEDAQPVEIGSGAWIGAQVILLKGVRIGARAVVGAGSVVTKDVPEDSIVAGNPARTLGKGLNCEKLNI